MNLDVIVGKRAIRLNIGLLSSQHAWDYIEDIKNCHELKLVIYSIMDDTGSPSELKSLGEDLAEIEYELQKLWSFPMLSSYHRFWECPKCTCPKMDNVDAYPYRNFVSNKCLVHGSLGE